MKKYTALRNSMSLALCIMIMLWTSSCRSKKPKPDYDRDYICISLSQYVNDFCSLLNSHSQIPQNMDTMFGMSWVDGYVIDYKNKDIILVGEQKEGRPVYHSEDIFTNFQNVFDSSIAPYCSLDPNPANILKLQRYLDEKTKDYDALINNCKEAIGGQKVVIGGVPLNSRSGKIMILADYEMKKISQGLRKVQGIRSAIDFSVAATDDFSSHTASFSRYWLHIKESNKNVSYPNYTENKGVVFINECPVVVLTQKQYADAQGNLKDNTAEKDNISIAFANEMSSRYDTLAAQDTLFAKLENMFRLQACFNAIKFKDVINASGIDLSKINGLQLSKGGELPDSLPGLVNYRKIQNDTMVKLFIVAGGVDQAMTIKKKSFNQDDHRLLIAASATIINQKPGNNPIYWKVHAKRRRFAMVDWGSPDNWLSESYYHLKKAS